jgi:uncharacterized protein (TIGR03067 family)
MWNALVAACLAVVAYGVTRLWRNPYVAHALWLIVLVKLVTPPLVSAPAEILPISQSLVAVEDSWSDEGQTIAGSERGFGAEMANGSNQDAAGLRVEHQAVSGAVPWDGLTGRWLPYLLTGWLTGAVMCVVLAIRRHRRLFPILASSQPADPLLVRDARRLASAIGLRRCPSICLTAAQVCPFAVSGIKGARVVLPESLLSTLSREQAKTILAHEIAHVKRGDHWIRLANVCVLALHWWNPVAWWATHELQRAEEECADAWVVWLLPERRRDYGRTLLQTVEYMVDEQVQPTVVGTALGGNILKQRIDMIVNQAVSPRSSRQALALVLAMAVIILPWGAPQATAKRTSLEKQLENGTRKSTTNKGTGAPPQKKTKVSDENDRQGLLGKWEVVFTRWYGQESVTKNRIVWEFQPADKVILRHIPPPGDMKGRLYESAGTYKLDTSVTPWHIDVELMEDRDEMGGGGPRKGILSMKQDALLFCISGSAAAPRPKKMVSEDESLNILQRMRRVRSPGEARPKGNSP